MKAIWRQALWMAHKDTRIFFRDRFAAGFMFLLPFLFVFGFSLALRDLSTEDGVLELAIATQERAVISAEVIEVLVAESDTAIRQVDYAEALAAVEAGTLAGFVAFPADFSTALLAGRPDGPGSSAARRKRRGTGRLEGAGAIDRRTHLRSGALLRSAGPPGRGSGAASEPYPPG